MVAPSLRQVGKLWPSELFFHQAVPTSSSLFGIDTFKKVVAPAQDFLGEGSIEVTLLSDLSHKDINTNDPVEFALAGRL